MSEAVLWLTALAGPAAALVVVSWFRLEVERLRRLAVALAGAMTLAALLPIFSAHLRAWAWPAGAGSALLRMNALSPVLLPLAAGLWLLTVAVTPRAALDRGGLRRAALASAVSAVAFLTDSPFLLLLLQAAAVMIFLAALRDPAHRYQRRIVAGYLGTSTFLFGAGVLLLYEARPGSGWEAAAVGLIALAALLRKGIVPFHGWMPELFDHGRMGPAILFSAPQIGAYMTAVLVVPRASPGMLHTIALLALVTAVYGAALALVQQSARRACGYLFMSQSALVMAGLACTSSLAVAGALLVWLSSGLAFAGLARTVLVLEARRGRLDLTRHHGLYDRMPLLAVSFLILGLACTGFPGTLGFLGENLLVHGAVESFPIMGYAMVAASALTGVAVLRMYFSLFCGPPAPHQPASLRLELRRREAIAFAVLIATLLGLGVVPGGLVDSRIQAGEQLLQQRQRWLVSPPSSSAPASVSTPAGQARTQG
ncbi:MAG TPA: proton-conducting transporter membrane subunit [Terriglobales bacterium]|nr:proton-conducting transporter membrane subunit [Terriglobales bacterium]